MSKGLPGTIYNNNGYYYWSVKLPGDVNRRKIPLKLSGAKHAMLASAPRKAAENAGLNLFSRYRVRLQYPMPTDNDGVVVDIVIPDEIAATFAVGNHLCARYCRCVCGGKKRRLSGD